MFVRLVRCLKLGNSKGVTSVGFMFFKIAADKKSGP